jgi:type II secretory pathway pseudopilin PulG
MSKAFTLIETLVSVIIVILLATAVYSYTSTSTNLTSKYDTKIDAIMLSTYANDILSKSQKSIYIKDMTKSFDLDSEYISYVDDKKVSTKYKNIDKIELDNGIKIRLDQSTIKIDSDTTTLLRLRVE